MTIEQPKSAIASSKKRLRVLVVEDVESDAELLIMELRRQGYEPDWERVCTAAAMRAVIERRPFDIVISDWSMPAFNGLAAFRLLDEMGLDLPFIIVSGTIGEEIAVQALQAGVHDFMNKNRLARLAPAIERELREAALRKLQRSTEAELSERRDQVEQSERLLRLVIDSVPDAVLVCDADGLFVLWNAAAEQIFGGQLGQGRPEEWSERHGLYLADTLTPYPVAELPLSIALRGRSVDATEIFLRNPSVPGGAWFSVKANPLRNKSDRLVGAVAVFRDVTQERGAQQQLMISDRMVSVGMLAAGVAHEINNPLAAVLANIDLVRESMAERAAEDLGRVDNDTTEMLEDAYLAAERVRQIVRDLRIFSRHEEVSQVAVDIHQVLESTLRMSWNEVRHRARLLKEYGSVSPVLGAESRLGQVFLNLVVNAAQAIPEGNAAENSIRIRTSQREEGRVTVEISDTGSGISAEMLPRLFTPFFTTKPAGVGTGLGLAICQRIVTGLGGKIEVQSEIGKGTTFRVTLRAAPASVVALDVPVAPVARGPHRRGRILAVDDEAIIGAALWRTLSGEHQVFTETRASRAIELLERGERFDVILCDLMMPEMTGMAFYEHVTALDPSLKDRFVFITGGAFTPLARQFLDQVSAPFLEKPFVPELVRSVVNERVAAFSGFRPMVAGSLPAAKSRSSG